MVGWEVILVTDFTRPFRFGLTSFEREIVFTVSFGVNNTYMNSAGV